MKFIEAKKVIVSDNFGNVDLLEFIKGWSYIPDYLTLLKD